MSIETVYRTCPTCEASCGLKLEVDRASREVISVKGDPDDIRSGGYVCAKSQAFVYIHQDPERLRRPVRKTVDGWEEISWEEALGEVGQKLGEIREQFGKDAIAFYYGNPNGHNVHTQLYTQLFITMMNTERFFSAGSVDQQPKNLACEILYGNAWMFPVPDLAQADFLVCMGGNPVVSQGSILGAPDARGRLQALQQRGGKLVVLDPRRSETAALADQHLFIRPGTDAFLLMAWVHELYARKLVTLGHLDGLVDGVGELKQLAAPWTPEAVEDITGISAAQIRQLVTDFSTADKPVLYSRIGLCTQEFGTLASWLTEVINILTGRLDVPGGAMFGRPATGQNEPLPAQPLQHGRWHSRARGFPEYMSMLPASLMAEELECEGQDAVKALITIAGNPVLSVPNGKRIRRAMGELDFVVALDFYINETSSQADIILPSITQLEHSNYEFMFSAFAQDNFARYSPRVLEPDPDGRAQYQLLLEIAARINGMEAADLNSMMLDGMLGMIAEQAEDPEAVVEQLKAGTEHLEDGERLLDIMLRVGPYGLSLDQVKAHPHGMALGPLKSMLPQALRTSNQHIHLLHPLLEKDLERLRTVLDRKPAELVMIGRRHIRDMNSWLHNITPYVRGKNRCTLLVNPIDAQRIGLEQGEPAEIYTDTGSQVLEVQVSGEMMPGVVSFPHGFGHIYPDSKQSIASTRAPGLSANDLIDDSLLDLPSGTSVVNGVPVKVRPAN
jgi:anaerobic selenocysteine-containing dehydrogenase